MPPSLNRMAGGEAVMVTARRHLSAGRLRQERRRLRRRSLRRELILTTVLLAALCLLAMVAGVYLGVVTSFHEH
jgi:hypothetical protein